MDLQPQNKLLTYQDLPQFNLSDLGESWSFGAAWNASLLKVRKDREFRPRDYIYAGELDTPYIDRYLNMKAVEPTNPPNERSYRKFMAGDTWERIVKVILDRAGLLINKQEQLNSQFPDLLSVHGRLDFFAGGIPDWEKAKQSVTDIGVTFGPEWQAQSLFIIEQLQQRYTGKLREIVIEIKSCSRRMYELYERVGKPSAHHMLQLYHYLRTKGIPEGHIVYICKDDCLIQEFQILLKSDLEDWYYEDIKTMSSYYQYNQQPPEESQILFNAEIGTVSSNWKVEYSRYLEKVYGFHTPEEYREAWEAKIRRINALIKRMAEEKSLTKVNLETLPMAKEYFPTFETEIVPIAKNLKAAGKLVEDPTVLAQEKTETLAE